MPSYTMRNAVVTRREYVVPCYGEGDWDGAAFAEVEKAIAGCRQELEAAGVGYSDDMIRVRPGDASIVVYYVTEEQAPDTVALRNNALRIQLRNTELALAELIGDPGSELSATTLARLETQLSNVQRALRGSGGS